MKAKSGAIDVFLIRREHEPRQTMGTLLVMCGNRIVYQCKTLELPYRNNTPKISAIPPGNYPLILERSPRFRTDLYTIKNVPGRDYIRIHIGNFYSQIEGCILLGDMVLEPSDINGDGYKDLRNSKKALAAFHRAMAGQRISQIHVIA